MKKIIALILSLCLIGLVGCASADGSKKSVKVVCAAFSEYDWVKSIADPDKVSVTILADTGTDMHSYQPTAADIAEISTADLVVYNGGTADKWMTDALKNSGNQKAGLRLMDVLADRLLCQPEAGEHDHHENHDNEMDEHVWLSLKNASIACKAIYDRLVVLGGASEDGYAQYKARLNDLDLRYETALSDKNQTVVFADRFPFVYMFNDYNIGYYAAFPGCSSETDADFETVVSLANEMDRQKLNFVVIIEGSNSKLAQTIIDNTKNKNATVVSLDSLQSVIQVQIKDGKSYLSAMEENLKVLKEVTQWHS